MDKTEENMLYCVRIADHALDYQKDIKAQVDLLKEVEGNEITRFTVIGLDGEVMADSNVSDSSSMENHKNREEVKEALENGIGYATRESGTLKISMLYVATVSANGNYILRMAVPFSGLEQYFGLLVPALLISIGLTLTVSAILANRFARSVTKPLHEIAEEMLKLKEENPEFHFK